MEFYFHLKRNKIIRRVQKSLILNMNIGIVTKFEVVKLVENI